MQKKISSKQNLETHQRGHEVENKEIFKTTTWSREYNSKEQCKEIATSSSL